MAVYFNFNTFMGLTTELTCSLETALLSAWLEKSAYIARAISSKNWRVKEPLNRFWVSNNEHIELQIHN